MTDKNKKKNVCGSCVYYDEQHRYLNGVQKSAGYGWCSNKSEYPSTSEQHQGYAAPPDCKVSEGALAKPYIVYPDKVQLNCLTFLAKP